MELTKINVNQNFFGIRALMAMFLGIDACKSYDARQHTLQSKLRDVADETCYCLLNNLFLVKVIVEILTWKKELACGIDCPSLPRFTLILYYTIFYFCLEIAHWTTV